MNNDTKKIVLNVPNKMNCILLNHYIIFYFQLIKMKNKIKMYSRKYIHSIMFKIIKGNTSII